MKLQAISFEMVPEDSDGGIADTIIGAFCAKFLPSLVAAYKEAPRNQSPYHLMLSSVLQNDYFAKFMRSPIGADFYVFYVNRLVLSDARRHKKHATSPFDTLVSVLDLLVLSSYAHDYKRSVRTHALPAAWRCRPPFVTASPSPQYGSPPWLPLPLPSIYLPLRAAIEALASIRSPARICFPGAWRASPASHLDTWMALNVQNTILSGIRFPGGLRPSLALHFMLLHVSVLQQVFDVLKPAPLHLDRVKCGKYDFERHPLLRGLLQEIWMASTGQNMLFSRIRSRRLVRFPGATFSLARPDGLARSKYRLHRFIRSPAHCTRPLAWGDLSSGRSLSPSNP
ncbi:hypothetical protein C8R43DRAFT_1138449 [Mycena crocata]|nr:hypothetical protein C8R43DRAFT_1138449 [Mycena crocata]